MSKYTYEDPRFSVDNRRILKARAELAARVRANKSAEEIKAARATLTARKAEREVVAAIRDGAVSDDLDPIIHVIEGSYAGVPDTYGYRVPQQRKAPEVTFGDKIHVGEHFLSKDNKNRELRVDSVDGERVVVRYLDTQKVSTVKKSRLFSSRYVRLEKIT